jgi:hypothetical protein
MELGAEAEAVPEETVAAGTPALRGTTQQESVNVFDAEDEQFVLNIQEKTAQQIYVWLSEKKTGRKVYFANVVMKYSSPFSSSR